MKSPWPLPINEAVKKEFISSDHRGRRKKLTLLSPAALRRSGTDDIYLAARLCLVQAAAHGEVAERLKRQNSKILPRSAAEAVRTRLRCYAASATYSDAESHASALITIKITPEALEVISAVLPKGSKMEVRRADTGSCLVSLSGGAVDWLKAVRARGESYSKVIVVLAEKGPEQVEDAIAAWHERMEEWKRQGREIDSKLGTLSIGGWTDDGRKIESKLNAFAAGVWMDEVEPAARRAWTRLHYKRDNAIRARTEKRVWEAKISFEAACDEFNAYRFGMARDQFNAGMDILATEFSDLRAETPNYGRRDAFFVPFINEFADFVERVTGTPPDPNTQAFERLIFAAHETLTKIDHFPLPAGVAKWDRDRAVKRHNNVKANRTIGITKSATL